MTPSFRFTLLFFFVFYAAFGRLMGQDAIFQSTDKAFRLAMSSATLSQNDNAFLPIKRVDSTRFVLIQYGAKHPEVLIEALNRYVPFSAMNEKEENRSNRAVYLVVLRKESYNQDETIAIKQCLEHPNVVVVIGNLEVYSVFPDIIMAQSIIHQFEDTPLSNEVLAQQVFGGAPIHTSKISDREGNVLNNDVDHLEGNIRFGFAPPSFVGMNGATLEESIDAIAMEGLDSMAYPGCQVLIAKNGKVVFHKTYGYHTYNQLRPVRKTDIYDLASVTKISSATAALMKLYGEGKFNIDAPLKQYFPRFSKTNKANLSWRQILAHNARLKSWIAYWTTTIKKNGKYKPRTLKNSFKKNYPIKLTDNLYLHKDYKEKKIYKMIAKSPLNEKPGYVYSGLSFYLYPEIVEQITGIPFETYLKSNIYEKIGATTITYNPSRFYPLERIIPTERDTFFRKIQLHGVVHDEGAAMMNGVSANAGLFASTLDLAKLMQMFMNRGLYGYDQILKPDVVDEFTRCQYCEKGNRRGLGFEKPMIDFDEKRSHVSKWVSKKSFGHSGYTGTFAWADPEHEIVFIFMSNRVYPTRLNRKLYTMNIRPRMQDVIYEELGIDIKE
jgi:CubicO group peptidase (beta-lactamase class C family)